MWKSILQNSFGHVDLKKKISLIGSVIFSLYKKEVQERKEIIFTFKNIWNAWDVLLKEEKL